VEGRAREEGAGVKQLGARARYVTIAAFCDHQTVHYMGYSRDAVERKIERQVWRKGIEYLKGPDGHILLDVEAIERWVEQEKAAA
jgi:hypothetical protein